MSLPTAYLNSTEVAEVLGLSPAYLRELILDRKRPSSMRKFSQRSHERLPEFVKKRGGRVVAWGPALEKWCNKQEGTY